MKKRPKIKKSVLFLFLIITLSLLSPDTYSPAQETKRLAIVPFVVRAHKDMGFLRDSIMDMLRSRLYSRGNLDIIDRGAIKESMKDKQGEIDLAYAFDLASKLDADYVLFGSLNVFGENISLDAVVVDATRADKSFPVFFQVEGMESVMPELNRLAGDLRAELLGIEPPKKTLSVREKAYKTSKAPVKLAGTELRGGFLEKFGPFDVKIRDISIGDVDGDGRNDAVFISKTQVFLYANNKGDFNILGSIEPKAYRNLIALDVADINHNGRSEIFVTDLRQNGAGLNSFVLEWQENGLNEISSGQEWYFRVLRDPERGEVLIGQARGFDEIFSGDIYEFEWESGEYAPIKEMILPKGLNVYSFSCASLMDHDQQMIVAFTQDEHVKIMDSNGNIKWTSSGRYGGKEIYLDETDEDEDWEEKEDVGGYEDITHFYMPQPVYARDLDGDGKEEIILLKNKDAAGRLFSRLRFFESGHFECLSWEELGMHADWKTEELTGYISDFHIGDLNNDGLDEIVFPLIQDDNSGLGEKKSLVVLWRLTN